MDVSALAGNSGSTSQTGSSAARLAENFDTFLTLLTTQLQYQDPLNPMDSNEFTQQLVQFTSVEQQIQGNKSLDTAVSLLLANQTISAAGYIGRKVEAKGDEVWLGEEGGATWGYELDATATSATLTISDASGKLVYAAPASLAGGHHEFVWDGKDAAGRRLPEGTYKLAVAALDKDGEAIESVVSVVGTVTAIETENGEPLLLMGRTKASLWNLLHVGAADGAA
jgi:flagellar basal-body rod modification protein FlgD